VGCLMGPGKWTQNLHHEKCVLNYIYIIICIYLLELYKLRISQQTEPEQKKGKKRRMDNGQRKKAINVRGNMTTWMLHIYKIFKTLIYFVMTMAFII